MMKNTSKFNRFSRGSSTYTCICGRLTRRTAVQSTGSECCPQCYKLNEIENEISDGNATVAERADEVRGLMAEILAKGGTPSFSYSLEENG